MPNDKHASKKKQKQQQTVEQHAQQVATERRVAPNEKDDEVGGSDTERQGESSSSAVQVKRQRKRPKRGQTKQSGGDVDGRENVQDREAEDSEKHQKEPGSAVAGQRSCISDRGLGAEEKAESPERLSSSASSLRSGRKRSKIAESESSCDTALPSTSEAIAEGKERDQVVATRSGFEGREAGKKIQDQSLACEPPEGTEVERGEEATASAANGGVEEEVTSHVVASLEQLSVETFTLVSPSLTT